MTKRIEFDFSRDVDNFEVKPPVLDRVDIDNTLYAIYALASQLPAKDKVEISNRMATLAKYLKNYS